ncbi:MAG TPA: hypothetical protein VEC35_17915 [Noviherbaspirillum sp.]|nr:hypothetical protein [Noviherbaspirillum sp.]
MNDKAADSLPYLPLWKRALAVLGCAILVLVALMFYPPAFESARMMLARPISSAIASDAGTIISPSSARRQQVSNAKAVVHGTYLKDPYGCVYMVEYVAAMLSVVPVLDEQRQPVCPGR